jgi:GTP-binding protein HflX
MIEYKSRQELAVLVGIATRRQSIEKVEEYLGELAFLVETAGGQAIKRFIQRLDYPDPRSYVGTGKLEEIRDFLAEHPADLVVFDDELSPAQIRNIEKVLECRILDRTGLILDIFARRARTFSARTQVELAQIEYLLPRLTRRWTHLEKQRGGIGLRGPGEQEIETDRRYLRWRISVLKEKLKEIDRQKTTQRKHRDKMIRVALVGYTNAGKSTLMNQLSKSEVFAEDKLFATLDTTVRKVVIDRTPFLLSDTVGFIRKLPHGLIESFKSTLDEVREADLLIHVADLSHHDHEEQVTVVRETLAELDAADKPVIMVFNKIDNYRHVQKDDDDLTTSGLENIPLDDLEKTWIARSASPSVFISATEKTNLDSLRSILLEEVRKLLRTRYPNQEILF